MCASMRSRLPPSWTFARVAKRSSGQKSDPAIGYGLGGRFRTPIGPIRADLAYGEKTGEFRLHFSVGYTF